MKNIFRKIKNGIKYIVYGHRDQIKLLRQINHQMDVLSNENKELKKLVTKIKKEEVILNQKVTRIERILEMGSYGVTRVKREKQLIVSFTSYGRRIETVPLMLERIFNQTVKPDRIILYLSKVNFPQMEKELPEYLLDMRSLGLEIRWCDGDIKSYKKIIPALNEFPNDIIITLDDDLYYDLDLIERLYDNHKKNPEAIIAMRTHKIAFSDDGNILPYNKWVKQYSESDMLPHSDLMATTGAGTLFPPHILPEETFNMDNMLSLCPTADDVWLMFMAALNHVPVVPPEKLRKLQYIDGTQEERLWDLNIKENDFQIQKMLEIYNNYNKGKKTLVEEMMGGLEL